MSSIREKVGQLFIAAIDGHHMTGEIIQLLHTYHVGGVYLQAKNMKHPKQVHHLINSLQSYAGKKTPLFIAAKLPGAADNPLQHGLTPTFNQQYFGNSNNRLYTKQMTEISGKEFGSLGINLNLALNLNPGDGINHFSNDLDVIAYHGRAAIEGYARGNMLAAIGHFPDHPEKMIGELPIYKNDFYPFHYAIRHGANAILLKNVVSETTAFLREAWEFDGLIIQDFFEKGGNVDTAVSAINHGADVTLLHGTREQQTRVIDGVTEAVLDGKISEKTLDAAVERGQTIKTAFQMGQITTYSRELYQAKYSMFRYGIVKRAIGAD